MTDYADLTRFIADCARNASEIETIWRGQGILAPSRVDTLARMWAFVVQAALLNGLDELQQRRKIELSLEAGSDVGEPVAVRESDVD